MVYSRDGCSRDDGRCNARLERLARPARKRCTTLSNIRLMPEPKPVPGDVVFAVSRGKDPRLNIALQRWILDPARKHGPWFSHVALVLNDRLALEASTAPAAEDKSWSGVELKEGVRLILLPDLLIDAEKACVLRTPAAATLGPDAFSIQKPHISTAYGSEYSINIFADYVRQTAPVIASIADGLGYSTGWTSLPVDAATQVGNDFRTQVLKTFPQHKFSLEARTYYCSELIVAILGIVGLLPAQYANAKLTPSGLYDALLANGWEVVTQEDYSPEALCSWSESDKTPWQTAYYFGIGEAQFWRNHWSFEEMWGAVEKFLVHTNEALDAWKDKFDRLRGTRAELRKGI